MPPGISEAWCERLLKEEGLYNYGALTLLPYLFGQPMEMRGRRVPIVAYNEFAVIL